MFDHAVYFCFYNGEIVESANWITRVLNCLNMGKLKKEMQIINFSLHVNCDNSCVSHAVCSSFIVQTRCGDMKPFAHFERKRQRAGGELLLFVKLCLTEIV